MSNKGYLKSLAPGVLADLHSQHKRRLYRNDPVKWTEEYLGIPTFEKQRELMNSVRDNRKTAVAAGHGVSKSFSTAILACWWVAMHYDEDVFVASTAPSADQVNIIWDYMRAFHNKSKQRYEDGLVDAPLPGYINGDNKWMLDGIVIGQGRKPPDNKSDVAFQGRHAAYLFAIGDEAVGLTEGFLTALNSIATGELNKQLLICNPTDPSCAMAKIWPRSDGSGGDETWHRMHISMFDSPLITKEAGHARFDGTGLSGEKAINEAKARYGEDSPQYMARVLGQWAFDSTNNVFAEVDLMTAVNCKVVPYDDAPVIQFGVDVATSESGDWSVVYQMQLGEVWADTGEEDMEYGPTGTEGMWLRRVDRWKGVHLNSRVKDEPGTAQRVDILARAMGATDVNIDASGIGTSVIQGIDEIEALTGIPNPYNTWEIFGNSTVGVDKRAYTNVRAEQFFEMKYKMFAGKLDIDPEDTDLLDELRIITYGQGAHGSALKIDSKREMKSAKVKSPDHADAAWYACYDVEASDPRRERVVLTEASSIAMGDLRRDAYSSFGW